MITAVLKILAGAAAVAALAAAATMIDGLPGSSASAVDRLQTRATSVLGDDARAWADVEMVGQRAILTGAAPDTHAAAAAKARIARAAGAGGIVLGGVTAVDARGLTIDAAPLADPFVWSARYDDHTLIFAGFVPSQKARDALYTLGREIFPLANISGALEIAGGAPADDAAWLEATAAALRALAVLNSGEAAASGAAFALRGEAGDDDAANAARAALAAAPKDFTMRAEIAVAPPPVAAPEQPSVETADIADARSPIVESPAPPVTDGGPPTPSLAPIADKAAADCVDALQDTANARVVSFVSARIDVSDSSRAHLRRIAADLRDCPAARIAIIGHTDSSGNRTRNQQLSGYRADAVRAFLIASGAPQSRVSARGAGSSEPIATNRTPQGRARNRRIEITVSRAEN